MNDLRKDLSSAYDKVDSRDKKKRKDTYYKDSQKRYNKSVETKRTTFQDGAD